jgi:hypothetical protein
MSKEKTIWDTLKDKLQVMIPPPSQELVCVSLTNILFYDILEQIKHKRDEEDEDDNP